MKNPERISGRSVRGIQSDPRPFDPPGQLADVDLILLGRVSLLRILLSVMPPWPILPVPAVLLALCRLVLCFHAAAGFKQLLEPAGTQIGQALDDHVGLVEALPLWQFIQ